MATAPAGLLQGFLDQEYNGEALGSPGGGAGRPNGLTEGVRFVGW